MFRVIVAAMSYRATTARNRPLFSLWRGASSTTQADTVKEIQELIKDKIRPTIQEHGGDLEFVSYENKIVKVRLQGACSTCPSSIVTLKNGVKNMLQYYVPEVEDVEEVLD